MPDAEPKKKKHTPKQLRVVFDTNALFTGSASDLMKADVAALIQGSVYPDLKISWYLPDVVRYERQFQMQTKALELLPAINKMERLLGHGLNINKEIVLEQVEKAVSKSQQALGLETLPLDAGRVDWNRLVSDAAYRRPPFQLGDKEKGFRDAVLVESFIQLVEDSPKSLQTCRLVLLSGDLLVREATQTRLAGLSTASILVDVEELKGLINTLVSQVDESFIEILRPKAEKMFFSSADDKGALYYKSQIFDRLTASFKSELGRRPEGTDGRANRAWSIYPPNFVKKEGTKIYWSTKIELEAEATRTVFPAPPPLGAPVPVNDTAEPLAAGRYPTQPPPGIDVSLWSSLRNRYRSGSLQALAGASYKTEPIFKGQDLYEVIWSCEVTTTKELRRPKLEELRHIELTWEAVSSAG